MAWTWASCRSPYSPDCLFVNQLYVLPEHQESGRRPGVHADGYGKSEQPWACRCRLQVMKVNPRAVAFYELLGFTVTGETATHVHMQAGPTQPSDAQPSP